MQIDFDKLREAAEKADEKKKEALKANLDSLNAGKAKRAAEMSGLLKKVYERSTKEEFIDMEARAIAAGAAAENAVRAEYYEKKPHEKENSLKGSFQKLLKTT